MFLAILRDSLEQFAFMFSEENDERRFADWREPCLHVSIMFSGGHDAVITLTAPESLCAEMAANILGTEPGDLGAEDDSDALKELANVVCGKLIPELFGDRATFDLSVPSSVHIGEREWLKLAEDKTAVQLWVEDKPMLAKLAITGKV